MKNYKLEKLQNGETFVTSEKGNSMVPLINSGQDHKLAPCTWEEAQVNDIVYYKVYAEKYYKAKNNDKGCQIGNNRGHINGWTKQVYGKVIEVL
jgi:hypothetical protein